MLPHEDAILHASDSKFCFAVSDDEVVLRLRLARECVPDRVEAVYGGKYEYAERRESAEMKRAFEDRLFAWYTVRLKLSDVRLVYVFRLAYEGRIYYFSEDGLTEDYDFSLSYYNSFQLPYINPIDVLHRVKWMKNAVFYQIFVDRFNIGRRDKDMSYVTVKWGDPVNAHSFAGGDIKGITEKLDYIKSVGANAVYLTPVFKAPSNHKYDIEDYKTIDPAFGTTDDIKELVAQAHARGMYVVLDAVFNHCSSRIMQFRDVLEKGKRSRYFDWFVIHGDRADMQALNYECFASCPYMPKWNTSNPEVADYLTDIALYWIREADIDGWRLDVSDEVSHAFWRKMRLSVKALKPECVLIGENWHDAGSYLAGDQFDSIMNYAFTKAAMDFFAFGKFGAKGMADKLSSLLMRNGDNVNFMMLNLLDSHDTHRFLTRVGGDRRKLLSAFALSVFFTGVPFIYYGTEIAMEGGYDPDCRRTMDWERAAKRGEVFDAVRELAELRRNSDALRDGDIAVRAEGELLIVTRRTERETAVLAVNNTPDAAVFEGESIPPFGYRIQRRWL